MLFCFFFGPFSIAITSLGEERANLNAFRTPFFFTICACLVLSVYPRWELHTHSLRVQVRDADAWWISVIYTTVVQIGLYNHDRRVTR